MTEIVGYWDTRNRRVSRVRESMSGIDMQKIDSVIKVGDTSLGTDHMNIQIFYLLDKITFGSLLAPQSQARLR